MQRWIGVLLAVILLGLTGCGVSTTPGNTTPTTSGGETSDPASGETSAPSADTSESPADPSEPAPTSPGPDQGTPATPLPPEPTAPPANDSWTLGPEGFGPIAIGESVPEDLQGRFDEGWECFGPTLFDADNGAVEVWTADGTVTTEVTAVVAVNERARTREGAWVGMTSQELNSLYPDLTEPSTDVFETPTELEILVTGDGDMRLWFEIEGEHVVGMSVQPADAYTATSDRVCGGP